MKKPVSQAFAGVFAALLSILIAPALIAQTTSTSIATGNWSAAATWNTPNFPDNQNPGAPYNAVIDGETVTLNIAGLDVNGLTLSSGILTGAFGLDVSQALTWTGGTMSGAGVTQVNGGMALGGTTKTLSGRTLNNAGAASWTAGGFNTGLGAIFNNQGGASFDTNFDGNFSFNLGGTATQFNNAGTFTKSGGTGTTTMDAIFNNTGSVNANSGRLSLTGGGTSTGAYTPGPAGTLDFGAGTYALNAGTAVTGAGTVEVSGATLNFNAGTYAVAGTTAISSGTANFNAAASTNLLSLSGGTLGGTATFTTSGLLTWSGGTMTGAAVTQATGGLALSGGAVKTLTGGRTLNNAGAATWSGLGSMNTGFGAIFNNSGSFDIQNDEFWSFNLGGTASAFNNLAGGTLTKSAGSGTSTFGIAFNNAGTVTAQSGTIALSLGGTSTGSFVAAPGGTIDFSGGTHTLSAASGVSGAGTIGFGGGTTSLAGAYNVTGLTRIDGGTANFNAAATTVNAELSGGTLAGTGTLTATGLLTWTGGTMSGAGVTQANGGLAISGGVVRTLTGGRTLNNAGAATWSGTGNVNTGQGAIFNNSGSFDIQNDQVWSFNMGGAASAFNNLAPGTLTKSAGPGTSTFNIAFSNAGTVTVQSGTVALTSTVTQYAGNTLTGGIWRVFAGSVLRLPTTGTGVVTNQADITLSGAGSVFQAGAANATLESQLATNSGALRILAGRDYTAPSAFTNSGVLQLGGGIFAAPALTNSATGEIFGFGTVSVRPANSGSIRAAGGTLTLSNGIQDGTGTVQIDAGAVLDVSGGASGSGADFLIHNGTAAGSLNLGANNFTVDVDYTNASFGTGNSFNPRANVSGAGQILASGGIAQQLTGNVTGGTGTTPTLAFGNVHVGDVNTRLYQINNVGASGPSLRGATQTTVNGGNVTDARLSGAGVTAANFGPIIPGANSGDRAVTFTATSAGALTGQAVYLLNNFDNVGDQTLAVTGAAFRFANPTAHTPEPVNFGNRHVGDPAPSQALTLTNNVPNDGFSESLDASIGSPTGGVTASGSFSLLAPGAANSTSLLVGMNTSTAGSKNGTATISLTSKGAGSSELGLTPLTSQTVNVTGAVYRFANPSAHAPEPVNFGNFHVGDAAPSQALTLTNNVPNDGFSEALNASIGSATGAVTAGGTFSLLAPAATNATSLVVGISTASAGSKNGTATINLTSDGTGSNGLGTTALAPQTVNVTGSVFRLAQASAHTPEPVNFGNFHVGAAAPSQALSITNNVTNDGFSEALNASIGTPTGGVTASGAFSLLAPAATNATSLLVGISTASAGSKNGTATINLTSDGTGTSGLVTTALAPQTVNVTGAVYRFANPSTHTPEPVNFGNRHVGDAAPSQALSITNNVANDGFSEALNASVGGGTGGVITSGSFNLLAPGATNNSSLLVSLDTASAGSKSGTALITFVSDGAGSSGLGQTPLASQTVNVTSSVFRLASASAHTPEPVVFTNLHVGDAAQQAILITNTAVNDGFSERLDAVFSAPVGNATASGSISLLAPQATNNTSLMVGLDTSSAGAKSGSVPLNFTSNGIGTSGLGTTALAPQTVNVSGSVFRLASASAHTPEPVALGNRHVGDLAQQALTIMNTAANDGFSERLDAVFGAPTGNATASGSLSLLAPQATNSTSLIVGINTGTAGAKSGSVPLNLASNGTGTSGLATTALLSQTVNVSGNVFRLAQATVVTPSPINYGIVHVGDVTASSVTVRNDAAADGFSEGLRGSISGVTGDANGSGSTGLLAAGNSDSALITVGVNTTSAGSKSGTATIAFTSDGAGTSGLGVTPLTSQQLSVLVQVNNFAAPVYLFDSGGATLSGSGNAFTLDFGTHTQGGAMPQAQLSLRNAAVGPADSLAGSFVTNAPDFTLSGFNGFSAIAAGQSLGPLTVGMETDQNGTFNELITLNPRSQNPGGFDGSLGQISLTLRGQVVPEPSALSLLMLVTPLLGRRGVRSLSNAALPARPAKR